MDWLAEPLAMGYMQRALIGALLVVLTTSLVGTWVVLRGLSFMGDALAHGVLPGIALGVLLGFNVTFGALVSALIMVVGINLVHRYSRLGEDTAIGLLFVGMLALGVVIISRTTSYSGSLTGILFGDALGMSTGDLWLIGAVAAVTVTASVVLYRPFLVLSYNEQKAEMLGLNPRIANFAMLTLVTMAVVASFQTVGTLLVFGLLIAPPATAALLSQRVPTLMGFAIIFGVVAVTGGLMISYYADTAASATMSGLAVAMFFTVMAITAVFRTRRVG
ncbi:MAG: iron chelate uptake ABC transporter family permease subunit [Acidimicrobiia bacterium]|nr:iron chelate uptake ABC transporter family permease subunit [Acidimicrobiia bacterium]